MKLGPINIMIGKKDGGPFSKVDCWGIEIKLLFSILVCRFGKNSRDAFHSHAFNSTSWLLTGKLTEINIDPGIGDNSCVSKYHHPSIKPIITHRDTFHKVLGDKDSNWIITFRGRWIDEWEEINSDGYQVLTHGRKITRQL